MQRKNKLIVEGSLQNEIFQGLTIGYRFRMHLTLFYSVALSCIKEFRLAVDQETIDHSSIRLRLKGKEFMPLQFGDLFAEYWNILDEAEVFVLKPDGLEPGEHTVEINLQIRFPFNMPLSPDEVKPDQNRQIFKFADQISFLLA